MALQSCHLRAKRREIATSPPLARLIVIVVNSRQQGSQSGRCRFGDDTGLTLEFLFILDRGAQVFDFVERLVDNFSQFIRLTRPRSGCH